MIVGQNFILLPIILIEMMVFGKSHAIITYCYVRMVIINIRCGRFIFLWQMVWLNYRYYLMVVSICGARICWMSFVRIVVIVMQDANRLKKTHFVCLRREEERKTYNQMEKQFIDWAWFVENVICDLNVNEWEEKKKPNNEKKNEIVIKKIPLGILIFLYFSQFKVVINCISYFTRCTMWPGAGMEWREVGALSVCIRIFMHKIR